MAIIKRFCFCCSLRGGSMFVASYSLLSSAFFIALLLIRNIGYRIVEGSAVHEALTYGSFGFFGLVMIMSITLIIGVHKNNRWLFLPWMIITILCHIFATITVVWLVTLTIRDEETDLEGWEIGFLCYHAINLIITTYCVICVFSHFQDLADGTSSTPLVQREYRRDLTLIFRERSRTGLTNQALNSDTPRPPPVSMVTPPPYADTPPPPPYSTYPRGMLSGLAPSRAGQESERSRGVSNSIISAGGPRVNTLIEEDEDEIDENIVGDTPGEAFGSPDVAESSEGPSSSEDGGDTPAPPPPTLSRGFRNSSREETPSSEERSDTPPPSPPADARRMRKPPTYRRILPETKLGRQLAEQERQIQQEQEDSAVQAVSGDHGEQQDQQLRLGNQESSDSDHSQGSDGEGSSSSPLGFEVRGSEMAGPSSKVDRKSSSSQNRDSNGYNSGQDRESSDQSDGHLTEMNQNQHRDNASAERPSTSASQKEEETRESDNNKKSEEDESISGSTFQNELSQALQRLKPPSSDGNQNDTNKPIEEAPKSNNVETENKERSSPREIRRDQQPMKKFATVSSSSCKIMDTTLQKSQQRNPSNVNMGRGLFPRGERERMPPRDNAKFEKKYKEDRDKRGDYDYDRSDEVRRHSRYHKRGERDMRASKEYDREIKDYRDDSNQRDRQHYERNNYIYHSKDQSKGQHGGRGPDDATSKERGRTAEERYERYREYSPPKNRYEYRDSRDSPPRDLERPAKSRSPPDRGRSPPRGSRESPPRDHERSARARSPTDRGRSPPRTRDSPTRYHDRPVRERSSKGRDRSPRRERYRNGSPPDKRHRHDEYYEERGQRDRQKYMEYHQGREESPKRERYRRHSPQQNKRRNWSPEGRGSSPPRERMMNESPTRERPTNRSPSREERYHQARDMVDPYDERPGPSSDHAHSNRKERLYADLPKKKRQTPQQYERRSRDRDNNGVYDELPRHQKRRSQLDEEYQFLKDQRRGVAVDGQEARRVENRHRERAKGGHYESDRQ